MLFSSPRATAPGSGPASATGSASGPAFGPCGSPGRESGPAPVSGFTHGRSRAIELLAGVRHGRIAMSMRALPFLAVARHLVVEGRVVLRMHRGLGFHESCDGSVVAYGADNLDAPASSGEDRWSVQFTGPAEIVRPALDQRELFGPGPSEVNGERFDPVYLRIDPQLARMHTLSYSASP
ncbi:pyridoxamine 5'-phosphate oxidase family protein [Streptomyces sp. NBC_01341]|uniref:pyridoxamine 5'-phosphate oxidase family protein n=1 Tax=Streptomyces sp. NBC_01341 TaxID=2903831 RepID=UPI002E140221|nr:pyridoxamine 5'-phosphate oxidase family protein [Streptomyces sp. NBC_01341]